MYASVLAFMLAACTSAAERKHDKESATRGATSYTELGVEYFRQGRLELSRTKLEKALELDPDLSQAHGAIAVLYEKVGENKLAEKHYKKALSLNPDNAREQNNYGQFLCFQERYQEANEEFMKAAKNPFYAAPQVPLYQRRTVCQAYSGPCHGRAVFSPGLADRSEICAGPAADGYGQV